MINVCTPRGNDEEFSVLPSVFLAGTIDLGNSVDWQSEVIGRLRTADVGCNVYNPRRVVFDSFAAEVEYQIEWELRRLDRADVKFFYIAGNSKSPITLMELGMALKDKSHPATMCSHVIVVCPPEFYRYQNVEITCRYHGVTIHHDMDDGVAELIDCLNGVV